MENPRSSEEIAELNKGRKISDTEAINDGAHYVTDPGTDAPRLEFTDEQIAQVEKEHGADYDPVYLREGKEVWREDVNSFIFNRHAYPYHQKYPFNYERHRGSNELVDGTDKYQRVAADIELGLAATGHEFGKYLGGIGYRLNRLMEKSGVPEDVRSSIIKKYERDVVLEKSIIANNKELGVEEYKKEIEEKYPGLVPKDKSVHEMNPLIQPFLKPLSEIQGDGLPGDMLRSARAAGASVYLRNFHSEMCKFMDEISVILKPWGMEDQLREEKDYFLKDLVGPAYHSFPEQDSEK
jgi:hypothetical protein